MQNATTIEIFILTYNRLPYLKSAINSALNQSIKNLKITIMDNCSTDGTEDYVKSLHKKYSNLYYYKQRKNVSVLDNFLSVRQLVSAEYVLIFHDDDILHPEYINVALKLLDINKNVSLIYSKINPFNNEDSLIDVNQEKIAYRIFQNKLDFACYTYFLIIKNNLIFPTCIFKTQNFKNIKITKLIKDADTIADKLLVTEVVQDGRVIYIDTPFYNYRIHSTQESRTKTLSTQEYFANGNYFRQVLNANFYSRLIYNVFSYKWFHKMYCYWGCKENYSEQELVKFAYQNKIISLYTYLIFKPVTKFILRPINYILMKMLCLRQYPKCSLDLRKEQV